MKKLRIALVSILALVLSSQLALGWWAYGHRLIVMRAFNYMPKDTPKFFVKGADTIAFYSADPDVSKNWNTPGLRSTETPEHYFDLEYFKDIKKLPKTRAAYIKYCQKNGIDPQKAGYLPYAINEWYERLVIAFAEHRKWPKDKKVQAKCLYVAGVLAHYAGDACQPLHTTIHYDGRSNKDKKSPKTGILAKMDALPESLGLTLKGLSDKSGPTETPDVWATIIGALKTSHKDVETVYKFEKKLPEAGKKPKGEADPVVKLAARVWMVGSARLLRTLYYTAWKRSVGIGLPKWHKMSVDGDVRPPKKLKLNNDAPHAAALKALAKLEPAADASKLERVTWHMRMAGAQSSMRNYAAAEDHCRKALKIVPRDPLTYATLSVYLGKQGKYKEAEEAAKTALLLPEAYQMHAHMALASWEWNLGKKREAMLRIKDVFMPEEKYPRALRTYYGCLSCFYASVGDEALLRWAIKKRFELDNSQASRKFFERDVVFDKYRHKEWFVKLVGKTLAEETKVEEK